MRSLGPDTSIAEFRLDFVFLNASLLADDNPEISSLASTIGNYVTEVRTEREAYELAEDAAEVMSARTSRRDKSLDRLVITFGGVVRSEAPSVYEMLFGKQNPSGVARSALNDEIQSVETMLGQLAGLPPDHPLRTTYETRLRDAKTALQAAIAAEKQTDTAFALAQSRMTQFKLRADRERHVTYGKLVAILGDKKLADEYFRPKPRATKEQESEPTPPAPPVS